LTARPVSFFLKTEAVDSPPGQFFLNPEAVGSPPGQFFLSWQALQRALTVGEPSL
jgi:hypothetical protein